MAAIWKGLVKLYPWTYEYNTFSAWFIKHIFRNRAKLEPSDVMTLASTQRRRQCSLVFNYSVVLSELGCSFMVDVHDWFGLKTLFQ